MTLIYVLLAIGFVGVFWFLFVILKKIGANKEQKRSIEDLQKHFGERFESISSSTNQALRDTIKIFTGELSSVKENIKHMHDSVKVISSFQDIFKAPKTRGGAAETMLEALLIEYLPKDSYVPQYYFKSGEAVDMVVKLPDGKLLPIDAKFPLENYQKFISSKDETERDYYRKVFFSDVKKKVDSISAKYILPSEGTVKHAFMYIPAESIYYEIINNIDIESYARSKRIIMVSPNILYPYLVAIRGYYKEIYVTKETEKIIKKLDKVSDDGKKLDDSFRRLGKHLSDAQNSYITSEGRLKLMLSKVEDISDIAKEEKEESEQIKEVEETERV